VLHHYTVYQIVWARYGVHLLFMLLVWGTRQPASLIATRRPAFQLGRSMLMVLMPASWAIAIGRGAPPTAVLAIFWLVPLMVLALAAAGLGERPRRREWLMAGCGFVGTSLIFHPMVLPGKLNFVLALTMGLSFSLYIVMTRSLRAKYQGQPVLDRARRVRRATPVMPWVWITPSRHDCSSLQGSGCRFRDAVAARSAGQRGTRVTDGSVPLPAGAVHGAIGRVRWPPAPGACLDCGDWLHLLAALVTWFDGRRPVLAEAT
jgi:hypothetical protein